MRIVQVSPSLKAVASIVLTLAMAGPAFAQDRTAARVGDSGTTRRAFQARAIVTPQNEGFQSVFLPIPAGKRLVIENISAIARSPEGLRMEINFFTYLDNNGDGTGDGADITFHRIALTDQGTFGGTAISSANHKVLVFAESSSARHISRLSSRHASTEAQPDSRRRK